MPASIAQGMPHRRVSLANQSISARSGLPQDRHIDATGPLIYRCIISLRSVEIHPKGQERPPFHFEEASGIRNDAWSSRRPDVSDTLSLRAGWPAARPDGKPYSWIGSSHLWSVGGVDVILEVNKINISLVSSRDYGLRGMVAPHVESESQIK